MYCSVSLDGVNSTGSAQLVICVKFSADINTIVQGDSSDGNASSTNCDFTKYRTSYIMYRKYISILGRGLCRMLLPRHVISQKYRNENVNTARSLEADRIEQVRIFTLLSRTEAIGSVTFV